jgi:hypothetical protein
MAADQRSLTAIEYLQQSLDDADVRKHLARGADAINRVFRQMSGRDNRVAKTSRRARLQGQVREAVTSFGRAGAAAREAELKRQRIRRRQRRLVLALTVAAGTAGATAAMRGKTDDMSDRQDGDGAPKPPAAPPEPTAVQ